MIYGNVLFCQTRSCTDIICCLLFLVCVLGMISVGIFGEYNFLFPSYSRECFTGAVFSRIPF